MPLTSGEHFAGYRILGILGSGGMGEVYLAQHPRLPRRDALKVLPAALSSDPQYRDRFNREAELASALFHPNIVGIHDRGEFDGQLWISMDYIDGTDAGRHLHRHYKSGMPPADVIEIVTAIADALDYAHSSGLLHRDVKPGNILFTRPTLGRRRILLADFGIARALSDNSDLTKTNTAVGTVNYCSPEQLTGRSMDGRADQYALAATAYQLLTGYAPFDDANGAVVISRQLSMPPPSLGIAHPQLAVLDPVFATALAKDPSHRFPSCGEFARALAMQGSSVPVPPPAAVAPAPPPPAARPPTAVLPAAPPPQYSPIPTPVPAVAQARPGINWAWPFVIGAVIAVIVLGVVVLSRGGDVAQSGSSIGTATPSTVTSTETETATPPTTTTTTDASTISFDSMRDLVTAYYGELPDNPQGAWSMLAKDYQRQTGMNSYRDFWGSVRSVSVDSVSPRSDDSVTARLTYVMRNGSSQSENRWLSVELDRGELLISDSALGG